jgi:hypothetical protein
MGKVAEVLGRHRSLLLELRSGSTSVRLHAQETLKANLDELIAAICIPEEEWDQKDKDAYHWIRQNDSSS